MSHILNVHAIIEFTLNKYHDGISFKPYPLTKEAYRYGYVAALQDFAIWNNGVQRIGAMQTDIRDIIKELDKDLEIDRGEE